MCNNMTRNSILVLIILMYSTVYATSSSNQIEQSNTFIKNTKQKTVEFEKMFSIIKTFFDESKNSSLYYYKNHNLTEQLSVYITSEIQKMNNPEHYLPTLKKIILYHDFRIVSDYLRAVASNNDEVKNSIENLDDKNPDYRTINYDRFKVSNDIANKTEKNVVFVDKIEDIFKPVKTESILMFLPRSEKKNDIINLIKETKGYLGEYIDSNLDLEGINSLVRKGLVKKIQLTADEISVTKKNNPDKKGRFENELINTQKMADVLKLKGKGDHIILPKNQFTSKTAILKMLQPYAIFFDSSSQNFYSITKFQKGKTLEDVLLSTKDIQKRKEHFTNIRAILEHLYQNGIVWGDLAPRNIIVVEEKEKIEYSILDFEKTKIMDGPVPLKDRIEHTRGPMCVEEFGTICTRQEVEEIFKGYFEPSKWDVSTKDNVPFIKPKRELIDILINRGKKDYTFGEYNNLELEVMEVRFPLTVNGKLLHPLYPSFKIDHYLGSEYDRKTTELFIKSKGYGLFPETISVLNMALEIVDNDFILNDLKSSVAGKTFILDKTNNSALKLLKELIDNLYQIQNKEDLLSVINNFTKETTFFTHVQASNPNRSTIYRNYDSIKERVRSILEKTYATYNADLFMIAGSFARKEMTYNSDLEIFIFAKDFSKIEKSLQNEFKKNLRMDIDMYAITEIAEIDQFLTNLSDYFIDFQIAVKGVGNNNKYEEFKKEINKVFAKPGFLLEVLKKRTTVHIDNIKTISSTRDQIKEVLNMWSTLEALGNYLSKKTILSEANHIKQQLLHYKSEFEFHKYYGLKFQLNIDNNFLNDIQTLLNIAYKEIEESIKATDLGKRNFSNNLENITIKEPSKGQKLDFKLIESMRLIKNNLPNTSPKYEDLLMKSIRPKGALIVSGTGARLFTDDNKDIIDFSSMTVNCILGQNDFWVKLNQAAYILSDKPSFHSSRLGSQLYYEIPLLLANAKIGGMNNVLINHRQTNGSDVTELAIQSAFAHKGNRKYIASFHGSYHGQNLTAYIISDKQRQHKFLNFKEDEVIFLDSPPSTKVWTVPEVLEERALSYEEEKIIQDLENIAKDTYAIILEPIQGNNSLNMFSLPLMKKIKEIAIKYDICLIFDEIQTGFGWLGKMTAAELYGIAPDILLLSKSLTAGNGPLSIAIFSGKYKESLPYGTAEKTNGADLRSLVAVKAVFERLNGISNPSEIPELLNKNLREELKDGLLAGYSKKVKLIEANLTNLLCEHPKIISKKVGMGLIRGIQVKSIGNSTSSEVAEKIVTLGFDKGILLRRTNDVIMIRPPLVISDNELFIGFSRLNEILNSLEEESIKTADLKKICIEKETLLDFSKTCRKIEVII